MEEIKPHKNKNSKNKKLVSLLKEYSLKQNNFNPSKPSPNMFIKKLEIRMKMYYNDLYNSYKL